MDDLKTFTLTTVLVGAALFGTLTACEPATPGAESGTTAAKAVQHSKTPKKTGPKSHFSDGTYRVGTGIRPGTYTTTAGHDLCYWVRLSGFSGELDDVVANGGGSKGAIVVTIKKTDKGFETKRCGTWSKL